MLKIEKLCVLALACAAFISDAQAFQSAVIFTTNGGIRCSATLIKSPGAGANACHLLTNAHCMGGDESSELHYAANFENSFTRAGFEESESIAQFTPDARSVPVKIGKKSSYLDLVELELPQDLGGFCGRSLDAITPEKYLPDGNWAISFQAAGFVAGVPQRRFSRNLPWQGGYANSAHEDYLFSLKPRLSLLRVGAIQVSRGMSGGPLTNNVTGFTGIVARYLPFQNVAFAIPAPLVNYFLNAKGEELAVFESRLSSSTVPKGSLDLTESQGNNGLIVTGDNILSPGGDNTHADGGDNSHADGGDNRHRPGGDNTHADGGGYGHVLLPGSSPLTLFREPLEGVVFENPQRILLAVNDQQVDGFDDALILDQSYEGKLKRYVTRPRDGYPDAGFRKQIFQRMDGYFRNNIQDEDGTRQILWAEDPSVPEGYGAVATGNPIMDVDFDAAKSELHVWIYEHPLSEAMGGGFNSVQLPQVKMDFKLGMNADGTHAFVDSSNGIRLDCDNRNFLKLICTSDRFELSFSRRSIHSPELEMRLALPLQLNGKNLIQVANGRFFAVREPERFRDEK